MENAWIFVTNVTSNQKISTKRLTLTQYWFVITVLAVLMEDL